MSKSKANTSSRNDFFTAETKQQHRNLNFEKERDVFNPNEYNKPGLQERDIMMFKEVFDVIDLDGKGYLTPMDMRNAMIQMGYNPKKQFVYQLFSDFDNDENGVIDFNQFIKLMAEKPQDNDTEEDIARVFQLMDSDKKGYISFEDLKEVAKELNEKIGDDDVKAILAHIDLSGKEKIDFKIFLQFMRKVSR